MIRCMGCMKEYEEGLDTCPYCGYFETVNGGTSKYLSPTTILQGRYIVGEVKSADSKYIDYIGFDALIEKCVTIRTLLDRIECQNIDFDSQTGITTILDYFQEEEVSYIVTDYKACYGNKVVEEQSPIYREEIEEYCEKPVKSESKNNNKILIMIVCVMGIIALILIGVLSQDSTEESWDIAEIEGLEIEEVEIEKPEVEEVEIEEPEIEEAEIEEVEIEEPEVEEPEVEELIMEEVEEEYEIELLSFVETMGGDDVMEFMVANLWVQRNYEEGTSLGNIEDWNSEFIEGNTDSDVATQILREEITENRLVLEGIISIIDDGYNGDYIEAPYWFIFELYADGSYIVDFIEIENLATKVTASYELTDSYGTYYAENVLDRDSATVWSPLEGEGNYVKFEYSSDTEIYGVLLLNGHWKSEDTYEKNGRITELEIFTDDVEIGNFYLNTAGYKSSIAEDGIYNYMLIFDEPVTATELYLYIADSIDGYKYVDVCVSEILIIAR